MTKITKGFTLIEILVVISIIGILMAISLFGIQGARTTARDTKRKADLQSIASGVEFFKSDCGFYPQSSSVVQGGALTSSAGNCPNGTSGNTYISAIPKDPLTTNSYKYVALPSSPSCTTACTGYQVWTYLENTTSLPASCTGSVPSCGASGSCNYCIVNP